MQVRGQGAPPKGTVVCIDIALRAVYTSASRRRLSKIAFEHTKALTLEGKFVFDERDDWSERKASAQDQNELIRRYGIDE